MYRYRLLLTVAVLAMAAQIAAAQTENRSLIYLGAGIEKDFSKKLSAQLDVEGRFCPAKSSQDFMVTPAVDFSPIKYLTAGLEYRIQLENQDGKDFEWSGRLGTYLKAKVSPSIFKIETRLKYCNYSEDFEDQGNLQYLRTKFEGSVKIKSIHLTPFVSYEWFYNISRSLVDKDRFTVGLKKKIGKRNTIGLEYMLEEKFNLGKTKQDINKHIFSCNYQYTIPAAKGKKSSGGKEVAP